jgi:hypothetical protein
MDACAGFPVFTVMPETEVIHYSEAGPAIGWLQNAFQNPNDTPERSILFQPFRFGTQHNSASTIMALC